MERKRYRFRIGLSVIALAAALAVPAAAQETRVVVNDREVHFPDQQPVQRADRIYIPLRGVLERIGAETIQWRPAREEVFVASGAREMVLRIGDDQASVNGRRVDLDAPPILLGGRTMVPLRFIAENLGATVRWEGYTRTVHISVASDRVAGRRETYPPDPAEDRLDDRQRDRSDDRLDEPIDRRPRENRRPRRERPADADLAPVIRPLHPIPGDVVSTRRPEIAAVVRDRASGDIDYDSIRMRLNGEDVTRELEIGINSVTWRPRYDLEPGTNVVQLTVRDRDGNATTRSWSFRVP